MKMFPNIADEFITTKLFTYDDINLYNFSLLFCLFIIKLFFFPAALLPNASHGLLIHETSRSHTTTHHSQ